MGKPTAALPQKLTSAAVAGRCLYGNSTFGIRSPLKYATYSSVKHEIVTLNIFPFLKLGKGAFSSFCHLSITREFMTMTLALCLKSMWSRVFPALPKMLKAKFSVVL